MGKIQSNTIKYNGHVPYQYLTVAGYKVIRQSGFTSNNLFRQTSVGKNKKNVAVL